MDFIREFLMDHPILSTLQVGFTIWMSCRGGLSCVTTSGYGSSSSSRRSPWIYFLVEMREPVFDGSSDDCRRCRISSTEDALDQLEYQAQQSLTGRESARPAERPVELGRFQDAVKPLEERSAEAGQSRRRLRAGPMPLRAARPAEAERLLTTIVSKDPALERLRGMVLLDVQEDLQRHELLIDTARQLVKMRAAAGTQGDPRRPTRADEPGRRGATGAGERAAGAALRHRSRSPHQSAARSAGAAAAQGAVAAVKKR